MRSEIERRSGGVSGHELERLAVTLAASCSCMERRAERELPRSACRRLQRSACVLQQRGECNISCFCISK